MSLCGRADAVTDLDEGADPSAATQGPAEGPAPNESASASGPDQNGAETSEDISSFARKEGEAVDAYARRIFERVYGHDIERVLRMDVGVHCLLNSKSQRSSIVLQFGTVQA